MTKEILLTATARLELRDNYTVLITGEGLNQYRTEIEKDTWKALGDYFFSMMPPIYKANGVSSCLIAIGRLEAFLDTVNSDKCEEAIDTLKGYFLR